MQQGRQSHCPPNVSVADREGADMQLDGQVAVITGGTRGIGFGIAQALTREGARVVLGGRSEEKGKEAVDQLDVGDDALFQPCDVREEAQLEALVDAAVAAYGRLDVMVNNVGWTDGFALVHEMTDEAWTNALALNLNATFFGSRRALTHMVPRGYGRIVNISSVESKMANKPAVSHYIANKHAINGLTKAIAFEYGQQGITCNAICPGAVETDIMKSVGPIAAEAAGITYEQFLQNYADESMTKKLNTVEEVAAMAMLLVGPHSAGITGALLNVDGGTSPW
jgi:NAD(P)-dependent dehydrogenase (short-subunit alcohol dehydrogenase family)